ncbi:hypothetical protein ACF0H5_020523 [Mactra antiquata]
MTYYYARDDFRDTTKLAPNNNRLGVSRDTRNQIFLSGSRLETTPGYVDLNSVNVYDKANRHDLSKTLPPTKASSVSQERNPYGWYSNDLSATRRTPVSELRNEEAESTRRTDNFDEAGRRTQREDRLPYLQDIIDIGKTRRISREDYSGESWTERDEPHTARDSPTLRQSVQELKASKRQTELSATQTGANLGRTQLGKTALRETVVYNEDDTNPHGWQALGPTRRPANKDNTDRNVSQKEVYSPRIPTYTNNPAPKSQLQEINFGDTLMPPKRPLTGTNLGQSKTYDYPYMRQISRTSDEISNAGSLKWITMATDIRFMRWMHVMFSKFRSKWIKDETPPRHIRRLFQRPSYKHKSRHKKKTLYTCPEKLCIAAVVTTVITFAVLVPIIMLRGYTQDTTKLHTYTMEGTLVNFTFENEYRNTSSTDFINIAEPFCNTIATNARNMSTRDIGYIDCTVVEIRNAVTTVKIIFNITLRPPYYVTEDEILMSLGLVTDSPTLVFDSFLLSNQINIVTLTTD